MNWREYWDGTTSVYVSHRHKALHYAGVADDIIKLIPGRTANVLDFGCGEALSAGRVAAACGRLHLCDGAPSVVAALRGRYAADPNIGVLTPETLERIPAGSLDLVVANSVLQYLGQGELERLLVAWKTLLKPTGRLILADVVPKHVSPLTDAIALLRFAARGGFLGSALAGLVRTFFSDYRRTRAELGLSRYSEPEMIGMLDRSGYAAARRLYPNFGHNQQRMAFSATVRCVERPSPEWR